MIEAKMVLVTPEKAKEYLERNAKNNRKIDNEFVSRYVRDMSNGNWQVNGESIKFNKRGELIDGQHRLEAIVKSNKSVYMLVVTNVENDVTIMDLERVRSPKVSYEYAKVNYAYQVEEVALATRVAREHIADLERGVATLQRDRTITNQDINEYLNRNGKLIDKACKLCKERDKGTCKGTPITRFSSIAHVYYCALLCGVEETEIKKFNKIVVSGMCNSIEQSSAIIFRNYLLDIKINKKKVETDDLFTIASNALNDFVNKKERKQNYRKTMFPKYINEACEIEKMEIIY